MTSTDVIKSTLRVVKHKHIVEQKHINQKMNGGCHPFWQGSNYGGAWGRGGLSPLFKTWTPQKRSKQQVGGIDTRPGEEVDPPDCHCIIHTVTKHACLKSTLLALLPKLYFHLALG